MPSPLAMSTYIVCLGEKNVKQPYIHVIDSSERVPQSLHKVADTPFHMQDDDI